MPVPDGLHPRSVDDEGGGIGPATTARAQRAHFPTRGDTACREEPGQGLGPLGPFPGNPRGRICGPLEGSIPCRVLSF